MISIHALRGEGDKMVQQAFDYFDISIHALRGEGDQNRVLLDWQLRISIHALRGEGDASLIVPLRLLTFQSTPSVGRATCGMFAYNV